MIVVARNANRYSKAMAEFMSEKEQDGFFRQIRSV